MLGSRDASVVVLEAVESVGVGVFEVSFSEAKETAPQGWSPRGPRLPVARGPRPVAVCRAAARGGAGLGEAAERASAADAGAPGFPRGRGPGGPVWEDAALAGPPNRGWPHP